MYGTQIEFIINESVKGDPEEVPEEIAQKVAQNEKAGIPSTATYDDVEGTWIVEEL